MQNCGVDLNDFMIIEAGRLLRQQPQVRKQLQIITAAELSVDILGCICCYCRAIRCLNCNAYNVETTKWVGKTLRNIHWSRQESNLGSLIVNQAR